MLIPNNPHPGSSVGLLSVTPPGGGALDLTCLFENANVEFNSTEIDASSVCQEGEMNQTTGMQMVASGRFFGASTTGYRTNYLDFASITFGGQETAGKLYNLDFRGTFTRADLPAATMGMASGIVRRAFSGSIEILFDDDQIGQALFLAAAGLDPAAKLMDLNMVLGGRAITLPIKLGRASLPTTKGDYMKSTIAFTGQAPSRGTAYLKSPTALPTSPGVLDLALLTPKVLMDFSYVSNPSYGVSCAGKINMGDFGFNYTTRGLTYFDYQFMSFGNYTLGLRGAQ